MGTMQHTSSVVTQATPVTTLTCVATPLAGKTASLRARCGVQVRTGAATNRPLALRELASAREPGTNRTPASTQIRPYGSCMLH